VSSTPDNSSSHTPSAADAAVVAVTYSPGETLPPFLASVAAAAEWPAGPRIVLADNGSTDGSTEAVDGVDGVTVVHTGGNLGFGGGANAGVATLPPGVSWVVVCNPDLVFAPGAIDALLAAVQRWPRAAAFGPQIRTVDGKLYPSARELPSVVRGAGHAVFGWWWPTNPWTKAYRRDHEAPTERPAGWLSGACLLLRREAFAAVGGFDERYFMYFEDVDLGERLSRAGWQNVYVPSAVVTHIGGHATSGHADAMTAAHHASAYRYLAGRYPARWQAPLRGSLKLGLKARQLLARRSPAVAEGAAVPDTPTG
jgi:N-acetylglucosaminyl-diphospho-decaprenol L-rhamnosyltransferase